MGHESAALGTILNEFVAQQIGLEAADSKTADALHLIKSFHEVKELLARGTPEVANVDTRQHNLLTSFAGCLACLLNE